jgi:hypothetical protein
MQIPSNPLGPLAAKQQRCNSGGTTTTTHFVQVSITPCNIRQHCLVYNETHYSL